MARWYMCLCVRERAAVTTMRAHITLQQNYSQPYCVCAACIVHRRPDQKELYIVRTGFWAELHGWATAAAAVVVMAVDGVTMRATKTTPNARLLRDNNRRKYIEALKQPWKQRWSHEFKIALHWVGCSSHTRKAIHLNEKCNEENMDE